MTAPCRLPAREPGFPRPCSRARTPSCFQTEKKEKVEKGLVFGVVGGLSRSLCRETFILFSCFPLEEGKWERDKKTFSGGIYRDWECPSEFDDVIDCCCAGLC